jgi:diguanylate cyclase (GGDEF)-like protein
MQQKYANVIAFITFFVMLVGYYLGYMDRYDFLNFGSALIVFSVFSFYIFKLVEKYQKMRDEKEEMLKSMAQIDTLTGIYNRRKFFELAKEINNPSALILMDLDKFKLINDTYGHHIGDLVLKEFANTVSTSIRKNDIFARIGGEEFALILPNITEYEAIKVAENLRKKIEDLNINGLKFTISMGVTTFHDEEITEALKRADKALYKAKKVRNRVEYI